MKILFYDSFAGISGDMNLGALIDLGVDPHYLISELQKLNLKGWELKITSDSRRGIFGTKVDVLLTDPELSQTLSNPTAAFAGAIGNVTLAFGKEPSHSHQHRGLKEIKQIIGQSTLTENVKASSLKIFQLIGQAEAKIHNKTIDEIHFHEVGAIDSIIDIVGAAICIDYLKPDKIMASSVQLGSGMVKCAHGMFPVPAPATCEILHGIPVKKGLVPYEATTPTGAAILAAMVHEWSDTSAFTIEKTAYGIGHKDWEVPNVLRVQWVNSNETAGYVSDQVTVIECNIDDMNPEFYGHIMSKLLQNGALDVYLTPIIMKKSRPATILSVLCHDKECDGLTSIIISETTTLGVRYYQAWRKMLPREIIEVQTQWGKVRVKKSTLPNGTPKFKPEFDDCQKLAFDNNIAINMVIADAIRLINEI